MSGTGHGVGPEHRLELLKLVYRHDKPADELITRASTLEKFLLESAPSAVPDPEPAPIVVPDPVVKKTAARKPRSAKASG